MSASDLLLALAEQRGAIQYGDFTLSSGARSSYYFDGRLLSLDPDGVHLIAEALLPLVIGSGAKAIGGPTLGADPIVAAVTFLSYMSGVPIPGFIVRAAPKAHGTGKVIEGPLHNGTPVAIVDDVCTSAGALFRAVEAVEALECSVLVVLAVLDRKQGGSDELRRRGYKFKALLEADDQGRIKVSGDEG
jgi:orotate phosphoribosyltransferase